MLRADARILMLGLDLMDAPHTPDPVADLAGLVLDARTALRAARDYSPGNPDINHKLTALVGGVHRASGLDIGNNFKGLLLTLLPDDFDLDDMHAELGRAESAMETTWARAISDTSLSPSEAHVKYETFWYLDEYEHLVRNEIGLFAAHHEFDTPIERVVYVGSGPLPISSYMLQQGLRLPVHCLDVDPYASQLGARVSSKLGWQDITFGIGRGQDFQFRPTDLVLVAAMATPKSAICQRLAECGVREAIFRTTEGVAFTLYREVDRDLYAANGYEHKGTATAPGNAVNSSDFVALSAN